MSSLLFWGCQDAARELGFVASPGFENVTAGAIFLYGDDIAKMPVCQRPVNTIFQQSALFPI